MIFYNKEVARVSGIPMRYADVFLDNITPLNNEQIQYKEKLWKVLKRETWCLTVMGTVGNGKTMLAVSAVNFYNDYNPCEGLYVTQEDLIDKVRATYSDDSRTSASKIISQYESIPLLVVDEITTRNWTEYARNTLSKIISKRHADAKRTILIGNIDPKDLNTMFEAHIMSRLREGMTHVLLEKDMKNKEVS